MGTAPEPYKMVKPLTNEMQEWLRATEILYFVVIGFEEGIQHLEQTAQELGLRISVAPARVERASYGCFDASSLIFDNPQVRLHARKLASEIGAQLFIDEPGWSANRAQGFALGYKGAQKLIVFAHNTPNCTLPILWKTGKYNQKPWVPLFPRKE